MQLAVLFETGPLPLLVALTLGLGFAADSVELELDRLLAFAAGWVVW